MCLVLTAIFWALFISMLFITSFQTPELKSFISAIITFIIPGMGWMLVRPMINERKQSKSEIIQLMNFRRNPRLFSSFLLKQDTINNQPWKYDLQIGNPDASLQLIVACNPFCGPCATTHHMLHQQIDIYKDQLSVIIRFTGNSGIRKNIEVVQHIVQYAQSFNNFQERINKTSSILNYWFTVMDLEKLKTNYPLTDLTDVNHILERYEQWSNEVDIEYTPTVFINGYRLNKPYSALDIPNMISHLQDMAAEQQFANQEFTMNA